MEKLIRRRLIENRELLLERDVFPPNKRKLLKQVDKHKLSFNKREVLPNAVLRASRKGNVRVRLRDLRLAEPPFGYKLPRVFKVLGVVLHAQNAASHDHALLYVVRSQLVVFRRHARHYVCCWVYFTRRFLYHGVHVV